jgi:hypothetical protein
LLTGGLLLGGLACGRPGGDDWSSHLKAESPCYEVGLADGLDDAAEVDALFRCLDRHDHMAPLRPTARALQAPEPSPATHLASAQRAAMRTGADPLEGAAAVLGWMSDADLPSQAMLDALAEALTGLPADTLRGTDEPDLSASPVVALRPALPAMADELRQQPEALREVAALVANDGLPRWLAGMAEASAHEGVDAWLREAGVSLLATRSPGNDRFPDASGDSARDLITVWVLRDEPVIADLAPQLEQLWGDAPLAEGLADALHRTHDTGQLEGVAASAAWLSGRALDGGPPSVDEPSVLARFVRLLATTNEPIDCELDLWLTSFEWSLDNLAVRVLQIVADLEPGQVEDLASVLGALSGNALSEVVLEAAIDSGTCPTLTHDTLDDLQAVVWLQEPEAEPLLVVLVEVLGVADEHGVLPVVADAVTTVHDHGGLAPAEELLADVGDSPAAGGLLRMLGALSDPAAEGLSADAPDLSGALLAVGQLASDPRRVVAVHELARTLLTPDATWQALGHTGEVLAADGQLAHTLETWRQLHAADPTLPWFDPVRAWLSDPAVVDEALQVVAAPEVVDALLAESPSDDGPPPLWWAAHGMADGTLAELAEPLSALLNDPAVEESP